MSCGDLAGRFQPRSKILKGMVVIRICETAKIMRIEAVVSRILPLHPVLEFARRTWHFMGLPSMSLVSKNCGFA